MATWLYHIIIHIIILTTTLTTNSHAEILTCDASRNKYCGPCTSPTSTCTLQCTNVEDICLDTQLQCAPHTDCAINCHSTTACLDATIYAGLVTSLTLNCNDYASTNGCEGTQVHIGNNADVTINCAGAENACKDSIINAQAAGNVYVNCIGYKSCSGLYLLCGYGECVIDCSGPFGSYKCDASSLAQINTVNAYKFECIGSTSQCLGAPAPFTLPTMAPTFKPTYTPTHIPISTTNPTVLPSVTPSAKPTLFPTTFGPTISPSQTQPTSVTMMPSKMPSNIPTNVEKISTKMPTNIPTNGPTNRPTNMPTNTPKPTNRPTNEVTVNPTDKPTSNPTNKPTLFGETYAPTRVTEFPTIKPTQLPSTTITITSTSTSTTLSPTTPQNDAEMCCECLNPSNSSTGIRGCIIDPECEANICYFDAYCCEDHWDKACVFYASAQCKKTTPKTTIALSQVVNGNNIDLDLVWKLALVVFAVMMLFVSCCCMLIRLQKMLKSTKTPKGKGINTEKHKNKVVTRALSLNEGKKYHDVALNENKTVIGPKVDEVSNKSCPVKAKTRHYDSSRSAQLDGIIDGIFGVDEDDVVMEKTKKKKRKTSRKKKKKTSTRSKRNKSKKRRDTRRKGYKKRRESSDESEYSEEGSEEYEEGISSDSESESEFESSFDDEYYDEKSEDAVTEIMQSLRRIQSVTKRNSI